MKIWIWKDMHRYVYWSIIYSSQDTEAIYKSIDRRMDKDDMVYIHTHTHIYTHNGIILSDQKEWNLAICSDMDGGKGYYAKQSKSVRERKIPYDFTHMWNVRNKTDELYGW